MKTHGKVDANQREIVDALRAAGVEVYSLASLGGGCPDLLAGYRGTNYLLEVKSATGTLTDDQRRWHAGWPGPVHVVRNIHQAIAAVGAETT